MQRDLRKREMKILNANHFKTDQILPGESGIFQVTEKKTFQIYHYHLFCQLNELVTMFAGYLPYIGM